MVFTKQLHPPLLLLLIAAGSLNLRPALGQQEQNFKFKNLTKRNDQDHTLDDDNSNYNSPHFEPLTQQVQSFDSTSLSDSSSGTTTPSSTSKHKGKRTLYACEKEQLQIECQLGESIQLIRANYGRFSIQICNEHGQLDWKVNCMSPDSYQRIANSCQAKQSCRLLASNSIFGDACPGTQKYLEVHYQCLPSGAVLAASNATSAAAQAPKATAAPPIGQLGQSNSAQQQQQQQLRQPIITARPNVIFPQQSDQSSPSTASSTATTNSERPAPGRGWQAQQQPPQLPSWIPELKYNLTAGRQGLLAPASTVVGQRAECPETIWRQVRWPATDAGHTARQPCPAHAQSGNPLEPLVASFACSAGGQWAQRAQAARCQSLWLRNLTSRFEQGDSPLSVLRELVAHTRPTSSLVFPHGLYSEPSDGLFGDDLIQLGRIVKRLAEETMGEYLHNIGEDKIRLVVAKEFVQSLVELINNLTHEQHLDAWLDLAAPSAGPPPAGAGERQRISAQLMGNLESALVLLAGLSTNQSLNSTGSEEFVKMGENVYAAIRPLTIAHESLIQNRSIEVRFPSEPSVLGTRWLEQRFSLNLQTSLQAIDSQVDVKSHLQAEGQAQQQQSLSPNTGTGPTTLKIVFVMIRGLGSQMESSQEPRMIVNSNLVSLSIVADSRSIKVDLSAPIELVFKHNFEQLTYQLQKNINSIQGGEQAVQSPWLAANEGAAKYSKPARCVYWDTNLGDWLSDGCLLLETNRTHSVCACNHLTTFALLSDLDTLDQRLHQQQADQQQQQQQTTTISSLLTSSQNSLYGGQNHLNYFNNRVQLDSVENELLLPPPNNQTLFYLAKLLDGHLFDSAPAHEQQQAFNVRLLVYISCLLSAILLAIYLAALAYNQAHARRLLGAIPSQPPPPLLVSNQHIVAGARLAETATYNSSTSGDSYSAALNHSMIFQQGPHSFKGARVFASNQPVVGQRGGSDKTSNANFKVPYYIYVQLFLLQLLLVFLVESQNYFAKNARHQQQHLGLSPLGQIYLDPSVLLNSLSLPTLGLSTWTVVILLYYLIGSLTVWLLWQLSRLNLRLALLSSASRTNQSSAPQIDAYNGNNIYGHSTLVSRNLYGNQSQMIIGAGNGTNNNGSGSSNNNNTATTISPTSSSYSSASVIPVGSGESRALGYALGQAPADLMKLSGSGPVAQDSKLAQLLIKLLNDKMIDLLVKHASPILFAGSIAYMTVARAQSVNMFTYTISYGSQLACWPLLLDLSLDLASFINYCVPMAALLLIALVTFYLSSISSKLDQTTQTTGRFVSREMLAAGRDFGSAPNQPAANPYGQQALKLQQQHQRTDQGDAYLAALNTGANKDTGSNYYGNHLAGGATSARLATAAAGGFTADQLKKAKFACFLLTSLVVFQSICWITLFAHIQRALHRPIEQTSSVCLYLFALANLGLVLILILVQRSSLRRACKLCGLRALTFWQSKDTLAADTMIGGRKGQKIKIKNSLHEHLRHSNSGSSGTENDERAFYQQASALQQQQQQATLHQRQASGEMKMSPSDQSLFLISQQARQYGQSNYGLNGFQTQAHHMYQQLTTNSGQQQHIYDSTTAVNNSPEQVMQLMQRQHQLSGGNNNFNRSVNSLHHLQEQNFLHQHQRQPMTLKPMSSAFSNGKQAANQEANQCQLLVLDAQSALKQQQLACSQQQQMRHLQLPGEADGPLVALSSMSSQASSTSSSIQSSANNNNNQLMQQQQPTTFGPANNYMASEHQLFNEQTSGVRQAGNCSATSALNANNNQYCANNSNYNDALKAAMIQQQQQQHAASELHNFRRQNSKQSRNFQQQQHGNNNHPQQQLVNQRNPALMGSMIDHQIGQQHNHHRFSSGNCIMMNNQDLGSNQEDLNGNIYDVANYVINH